MELVVILYTWNTVNRIHDLENPGSHQILLKYSQDDLHLFKVWMLNKEDKDLEALRDYSWSASDLSEKGFMIRWNKVHASRQV